MYMSMGIELKAYLQTLLVEKRKVKALIGLKRSVTVTPIL